MTYEDAPCASEAMRAGRLLFVWKLRCAPTENRKLRITVVRIKEALRFYISLNSHSTNNHTIGLPGIARGSTRKENTVKKSMAVLSLSLAATFGLAACSSNAKAPAESQSASTSASASASASASSSASAAATTSASTSASASASANANSSSSSAKESGSQKGGLSGASSMPTDVTDSSYGSKVYEHYKETVEEAKKDHSTKRTTNTEGNVYADPDGSIAVVEAKNGSYISIENDGGWVRVTPEGEVIAVTAKGGWAAVKPNGEIINVDENGAASIMNVKTSEVSDDYQSLEVPKTPAPVGDFPAPKSPVKPTSMAAN